MTTPPSNNYHRRSVRLRNYDYSQAGTYFITLCSYNRESLFGEIIGGEMVLNNFGQLVAWEWERSAEIRKEIELDAWVVMPNHMHAVFVITQTPSNIALAKSTPAVLPSASVRGMGSIKKSMSSLMQGFKSATTKQINIIRGMPRVPVWQRGLYDIVIGDEDRLKRIREYIANNPGQWMNDSDNPAYEGPSRHGAP